MGPIRLIIPGRLFGPPILNCWTLLCYLWGKRCEATVVLTSGSAQQAARLRTLSVQSPMTPSFELEVYKRLLVVPTARNDIGGNLGNKVTEYLPINLLRECEVTQK